MQRRRAVALHGCVKSAIGAGSQKRRETMRLITASDLASKTLSQLSALYRMISEELAQTEPHSTERANMIASLKNISLAIASRRMSGPKF
jgi:hypothetical protein